MNSSSFRKKAIRSLPYALGLALSCPWTAGAATVTCNAATVPALNSCFATADANPGNSYKIILTTTSKAYFLTKTLTLTQGTVYLSSSTGTLATAQSYVLDSLPTLLVHQRSNRQERRRGWRLRVRTFSAGPGAAKHACLPGQAPGEILTGNFP